MKNELFEMKNIVLENGCVIKPIYDFEEFSDIIDVFKEPPFSEPLTLEDKHAEYNGYLENGLALGFYTPDGKIMGMAGLMKEIEDEHQIYFDQKVNSLNPFYIYGLATKAQYRGHGVCTKLMEVVDKLAEETGVDFVYLRTNCNGSMSEGLCRKLDYVDLYQNGSPVIQTVDFERNDPNLSTADDRFFLIKAISKQGDTVLKETGAITNSKVLVKSSL